MHFETADPNILTFDDVLSLVLACSKKHDDCLGCRSQRLCCQMYDRFIRDMDGARITSKMLEDFAESLERMSDGFNYQLVLPIN